MKYGLILIFFFLCTLSIEFPASGQKCKVLLEILSDQYEGDCRKGLADGKGTARGEGVAYEGEFRKGLPHGDGILTFEDGTVFTGELKFGEIYGYGELKKPGKDVQAGYFKGSIREFRYMGEEKSALAGYRVLETERFENATYTFVNADPEGNGVTIKIFENNIRRITNFEILEITSGVIQLVTNEGGRLNAEIVRVDFPITLGLRYILPYGTQDTTLPGGVDNMNSPRWIEFTILEPGQWTVSITHR